MTMIKSASNRVAYGPAKMKLVNELVKGFVEWNGGRDVITISHIKEFLKTARAKDSYSVLVLNQLQRDGLAARKGQQHNDSKPTFIMVNNLPIRFKSELSAETTARLIGSSLTASATMARMTFNAMRGNTNVQ